MEMNARSETERNKAVADAFYQAGVEGRLTAFAQYLDPGFHRDCSQLPAVGRPIKIPDLWTIRNGKAVDLWVAYFEPQGLLDKLGVTPGLRS